MSTEIRAITRDEAVEYLTVPPYANGLPQWEPARPPTRRCYRAGMSNQSPASIAAAYFGAWTRNDIEQVRPLLHPDVTFAGALGSTQGAEETLAGLTGMFAMTERVEVVKRWADGPDVLTWFELRTATAGPLAIVNWSHIEDGLITRIRVTFDPRPLLG